MNLPLYEKLRPKDLSEVEGQDHLTEEKSLLVSSIQSKSPLSLLFWGPPGSGKTTLARLYLKSFDLDTISINPVSHSILEIKKILDTRKQAPLFSQKPLLVFVDEIHRFNKAQQDVFLPHLENGTLILIGATTENPSFAINNALLSRLQVLPVVSLEKKALERILERFSLNYKIEVNEEAKNLLCSLSSKDARHLCNLLQNCLIHSPSLIDIDLVKKATTQKMGGYDKNADEHYNCISCLHKSIRSSDVNASLYYFARMLNGGESPDYIARRLLRIANEDIGLADPQAMQIANSAWDTYKKLGSPEGELALAQCVIYLALSPKSNACYSAFQKALDHAKKHSFASLPKNLLNPVTDLMKNMEYGKNYEYDHDTANGCSNQRCFPDEVEEVSYYEPKNLGFEKEMVKRIHYFQKLKKTFASL